MPPLGQVPLGGRQVVHVRENRLGCRRRHSQQLADLPSHGRSRGLPHGGENALVVRREQALLHIGGAVWDQHDRPVAHLLGHRQGRDALISDLFAHPLKDPFGDNKFVALGPYLRQLLGQPFFELVKLRASRGDPFQ
ncbi:hypothetical protein [Streptomyces rubiginosohelvolus]|uniref:hypothetical protein n=1 Tax=Streptomyces rubiginosohelvolus TaxID=67362 RepID=UPI0035D94DA2